MAKVTIDNLAYEIEKILDEYGDEVKQNMDEVTKRVAKSGVQVLRAESRAKFGGTGKYASGWTVTTEKSDRWGSTQTIHNKVAGLPHLLEHGHAKRNGGRVAGRPHIAPVEERLIQQFTEGIERNL